MTLEGIYVLIYLYLTHDSSSSPPKSDNTLPFTAIYVAAGYMGSVSVVTTVKWFWFLIGLAALFAVVVHFAQVFKAYADAKGGEVSQLYGKLAWLSILAWICYPVVWLFSEGFASFSVSFEVCAYAILDMITKVVVSFMVMSGTNHLPFAP